MTSAPTTHRWYISQETRHHPVRSSSSTGSMNQAEGSALPQNQQTLTFVLSGTRTVQMSEELELLLFQTHEQRLHGQLERRINPSARWADHKSYYPQETDSPLTVPADRKTNEFRTSFFQQEPLQQRNHHKSAALQKSSQRDLTAGAREEMFPG